jgi:small subunit ribosomal protein S16
MLAIRLQRHGRKAYPIYRLVVQESQRHPSSGRVVAYVGSYNPHTKDYQLDKEKVERYLKNGAQPSPRVVKLLILDKISLPAWVQKPRTDKQRATRNPDKLRKNRPAEPAPEVTTEAEPETAAIAETDEAAPAPETTATDETPAATEDDATTPDTSAPDDEKSAPETTTTETAE